MLQGVTNSLFRRCNKWPGNGTAKDFVDEFKAFAMFQRLNSQIDFTKLACATGLFFVPVMTFRAGGNGFAVGDAR